MNKFANMRHWSDRIPGAANFGMSRPNNMGMQGVSPHPHPPHPPPPQQQHPKTAMHPGVPPIGVAQPIDTPIHYSFNVPFASDLAGPDTEDILHATADSLMRWTHPEDAPDDVPVYELPVHTQNLGMLRKMCRDITQTAMPIEAHVLSTVPKGKTQVTTVCLSGAPELVYQTRESILNQLPIALRCATVDVDGNLFCNLTEGVLKEDAIAALDDISKFCGVDIFLLGPKLTPMADGLNGDVELRRDQRWRVAIYGDLLSSEHGKTRVLIHIDRMLGRVVDAFTIELSVHQLVCGRSRKNIKMIESMTNTAIYFPPPFSEVYRYCPPNAERRNPQQIFITGENPTDIQHAKLKFQEHFARMRLYVKEVSLPAAKIDSILLTRLDKVRKIMEVNGTFILFPRLGSRQSQVSIQAVENLHAERTVKELMTLAGQFYTASWWISQPETRLPSPDEIRTMLGDVCANSDADVSFDKLTFSITGSDEAVKAALMVISQIKFVAQSQYQIRVKIELANEHKEFVSGKKNGKINKIMGQANVQIMFDSFGEYNFNIDVMASNYEHMQQGLALVEQEMPASISFHVPDQYHKRIIGIGGQHIQKIMKKHSVFVKFSNAMDRGAGNLGREDEDSRVDNVICRTPARNAQNLELVKAEILEMVDRADSEFTSQIVNVDRLYHRQLITRLAEIDNLEKKWNCKIVFPSTEQASDEVTVTGPQWQVPMCVDEFLGMVPDSHQLVLKRTPTLVKFLESPEFVQSIIPKLKKQYEVNVEVRENPDEKTEDGSDTIILAWTFTRNNAGGLRDAIDFLQAQSATVGVEATIVRGDIPRPKSDTFEDSLQFFDSKILQQAPASTTDSPTKPSFGDEVARERSTIFDKLRKPGSMSSISSFLDRRKNSSHSATNSFFKGSSNVSKSSLISIESTRSFNADRNPWNDSGVNLPDDDNPWSQGRAYAGNGHDHKLAVPHPGDVTPRHNNRQSGDSGRPSTSHSTNSGYPGHVLGPNFR